jgi:hypothetical protein
MSNYADGWAVQCSECGDRVLVAKPPEQDADEEPTGTAECRRGHILLFRFDGVTVTDGDRDS